MSKTLKNTFRNMGLYLLLNSRLFLPASIIRRTFSKITGITLEYKLERARRRPVKVCNYKSGAKACFCLSMDFDLPKFTNASCDWQHALKLLLDTTKKYDVPISWGICGSFIVNSPEIMSQIMKSSPPPDVGVHTFSHRNLADPLCTEKEALIEIRKSVQVLEKLGVSRKPVTFIFPWNRIAHLNLLEKEGFIVYRGNRLPKLTYPQKTGRLWNIHGTYYLTEKSLSKMYFTRKIIDFALAYGCVFHLWLHPWNAHVKGDVEKFVKEIFEPILAYAASKKDRKLLWICTLRELANYSAAKELCHIDSIERTKDKISFSVHCAIKNPRFDLPPSITLQIEIPSKWRDAEVYVDDVKQHLAAPEKIITKHGLKKHLLLTLSFKKPRYKIYLTKAC
jgi:hypothetical protein